MAHFYGSAQGSRGETHRLGGKEAGMRTQCRSWKRGVSVYASNNEKDGDIFNITIDGGSGGGERTKPIAHIEGNILTFYDDKGDVLKQYDLRTYQN